MGSAASSKHNGRLFSLFPNNHFEETVTLNAFLLKPLVNIYIKICQLEPTLKFIALRRNWDFHVADNVYVEIYAEEYT